MPTLQTGALHGHTAGVVHKGPAETPLPSKRQTQLLSTIAETLRARQYPIRLVAQRYVLNFIRRLRQLEHSDRSVHEWTYAESNDAKTVPFSTVAFGQELLFMIPM